MELSSRGGSGKPSRLLPIMLPVILAGLPGGAWAQQQGPSTDGDQLTEIVITAEKRVSTVQQTPISITAVSGDQLSKEGITDVGRLASQVPGIAMASEGPGRTQFNIRGLSSSGGSSPTVGFYLDDVPVTPPTSQLASAGKVMIDPDLYDLARVEILRGPQGTLYGASSMGGTIRLITNDPDLEHFSGRVQAGVSGTDGGGVNYSGNFMLNVPIVSDKLALRLVGTEKYNSGFIDRIVANDFPLPNGTMRGDVVGAPVAKVHSNDNDDRTTGFRATLLFKPTEDLSIEPAIFHQRLTTGALSAIDMPPGTMAHYQPYDVPESSLQAFDDYSLRIKYDLSNISLQSITSLLRGSSYVKEDDAESQYFAFGPMGPTGLPTDNSTTERHSSHQFNQELRVSSNDDSILQWVAGGFYSRFSDHLLVRNTVNDLVPIYGTANAFTDVEPDSLTQQALFGEVNYQFLPDWKATVGLRYFHYRFEYQQNADGLAAQTGTFSGAAGAYGLTPKFTLTYTPDKNLLFYATASKGYRPGGPNLPIPTSGVVDCSSSYQQLGIKTEPSTFGPDAVWNYEIGEKAKLLDGRMTLNSSFYYIDWQRIQLQTTLACGYFFTANSGKAYSEGAEVEASVKLGDGFRLNQSLGTTRSALTDAALPGNSPIGQQLPDVPRWTATTSLEYSRDIAGDLTFSALVTNRFVDAQYDYSAVPASYFQKPAYDLVDMRIGLAGGSWTTSLYIDNLFDRRAVTGINRNVAQNNPYYARVFINRPRTIGVTAETEF
ncbi:outer membrane receptor protein involved in Fe transport [Nitrospirillum viridazoti]|nr:outer membrane receptor protein involved in Fe transport [Nitrospirillum amazonense]